MAEENKGQGPEQEQVPEQEEGPAKEPEEAQQEDKPAKKKEGLLMPILYALLAGVGAFTLALIIGIVVTILTQPAEPSETPSAEQSSQVTFAPSPTQTPAPAPDGEGGEDDAETQSPQESDGEDTDTDATDAPE